MMRVIEGGRGKPRPETGTSTNSDSGLSPSLQASIEEGASLDRALMSLAEMMRLAWGPQIAAAKLIQAGHVIRYVAR
jgi:hypothetical protein